MPRKNRKAAAALQYLDQSFFERHPRHLAQLEETRSIQEIARAIYDLRARAGLSHRELARASGMTARAIEKLENAEHPRQSLALLRRVAAALGKRIELRILSARKRPRPQESRAASPSKRRSARA